MSLGSSLIGEILASGTIQYGTVSGDTDWSGLGRVKRKVPG
jgi:hypothetical protein